MKQLLAAFALIISAMPGLAVAQGCDHDDRASMSCAEGYIWDDASSACIVQTS